MKARGHDMSVILVNNLCKTYTVVNKKPGIKGSILALFKPDKKIITALDNVSFSIEKGEAVGYIGPNGAGKSTTIKSLIGVLQPTSGTILVDGLSPQKDRIAVAGKIGVIFGQRSGLVWDIRLNESFELNKRIYRIDNKTYNKNRDELIELLDLKNFINTPVRQLSLGQRMRGEIAAALLHSPSILFLDEPTIGLDFESRNKILDYIKYINTEKKGTVILTSHNMADIEKVCNRVVIINKGKVIEDGSLQYLKDKIAPYKLLKIQYSNKYAGEEIELQHCEIYKKENGYVWYRLNKNSVNLKKVMEEFVTKYEFADIKIEDPDIETVIKEIYAIN